MPGAGTDKTKNWIEVQGPIIVLVEPQLGENIGAAARVMANCGLRRVRLVKARDGWPNMQARRAASGADRILENAQLCDTVEAAIADCTLVLATTARAHDQAKPVISPDAAATLLAPRVAGGENVAVLFGRERYGLQNEEVALADRVVTFPVNPAFAFRHDHPPPGGRRGRSGMVNPRLWRRASIRHATKITACRQRASAGVLRQSRAPARSDRIFPPARETRHHARELAQHLRAHATDPARHPDPARHRRRAQRRPQRTRARRRARRRGSDRAACAH